MLCSRLVSLCPSFPALPHSRKEDDTDDGGSPRKALVVTDVASTEGRRSLCRQLRFEYKPNTRHLSNLICL